MDDAPWFDRPDAFDQRRIRLADIDGSGTTDLIYLGRDGVRLYFNQSGNRWSEPQALPHFRAVDDLATVRRRSIFSATAPRAWCGRRRCPATRGRPLRYVDLMGGAETAPAGQRAQQPRRRDTRRLRAVDEVLPADKLAGDAVDHPAAVPGARRRAGGDLRLREPQPVRHALQPITTATTTASSASSAASAWWSSATPRNSPRSPPPACSPMRYNIDAASHVAAGAARGRWFHTGVYRRLDVRVSDRRRRVLPRAGPDRR